MGRIIYWPANNKTKLRLKKSHLTVNKIGQLDLLLFILKINNMFNTKAIPRILIKILY